jgi:MFS transporter, putative metabolite:H+ symporter
MDRRAWKAILSTTVIVGGLGYFVDIFDLLLFPLLSRQVVPSFGLVPGTPEARATITFLLNWQMGGMLLGGVLWGILGDKKGRLTVLFGSILLYSVANLSNAFVTNIPQFAAARFFAGLGLAGELGAAITLVSESLAKEHRGYGTGLVSAIGIAGAVFGGAVALFIPAMFGLEAWRIAFIIGGLLGFVLLITRLSMRESLMFSAATEGHVKRGDIRMLAGSWTRMSRFIRTTLVGLPIWCLISIFITLSPDLARDNGISGIDARLSIMWFYGGASLGGFFWASMSQIMKGRKNTTLAALSFTAVFIFAYFFAYGIPQIAFYLICAMLGVGTGYWSVFVTMAAEQFGTNLRATVATSVPNFIRGTTVPLNIAFVYFSSSFGLVRTAMVLAAISTVIALFSLRSLEETYHKDLDFLEESPLPAEVPTTAPSSSRAPRPLT